MGEVGSGMAVEKRVGIHHLDSPHTLRQVLSLRLLVEVAFHYSYQSICLWEA